MRKNNTKISLRTTSYEYDLFGLVSITYPDNTEEHLVHDNIGNVVQKITGTKTIHYHYNSVSLLIEVEYPDSSVYFTYDANGNRISMVDSVSSSVYVYDSQNRLLSETKTMDNEEYTTSYSYDPASNIVSITYPDGTVVNQSYDLLNRITSVEGFSNFTWNGNSQIEEITYTNSVTTNYTYDLRGRSTQIRTTKNGSDLLNLNYTYDSVGNILQMVNSPNSLVTEQWDYTYDTLNRLLTAAGGPQGDPYSLNYSYDKTGNRTQLNNTVYTYNNMNELLSVDSEGLGDPGQLPWWDSQYQYRREITFGEDHDLIPEGYTCTFTMDTIVAASTSGDDVRIVYQTDTDMIELDRIGDAWNSTNTPISFKIQSEIPANAERGSGHYFVYYNNPQAGPPPANPSNVYIFYDDFNRPNFMVVGNSWIEDEQNLGIGILRIYNGQLRIEEHRNEYAHAEQVLSEDFVEVICRIKPDANAGYGWAPSLDLFWNDSNNGNHIQMLITSDDGKLGCKIVVNGTVDAQWLGGVVSLNQYNWVRIRLTPSTIYFDYGGTGTDPVWVNKRTISRPTQLSGSFSKLILGKGVEQVSYTNPDLDNNYATPDNLGVQFFDDITVRKYIENPPEISLETEETEELEGEPELHYTFTYDEYGNCISKSDGVNIWEYHYDYGNRLVSIGENGQVTEQYFYDGDGKRIKKIDSESTRIYINSGVNVLYEINMTALMEAIYVYGPTGRIAKKVNDITEFFHTDHLGSTRLTTSETGSEVTELHYKPFGEQINASEERYTYNGKELDSTGLYYYGARYYDSDVGRFITRDTAAHVIMYPQSLNRYTYCRNNPLQYVDPDGRMEKKFTKDTMGGSCNVSGFSIAFGSHLEQILSISIESTKGNTEVTVKATLMSWTPVGGGSLSCMRPTAVEVTVANPEGSVIPESVEVSFGSTGDEGLQNIVINANETGGKAGYEYVCYCCETNSTVIMTISLTLDSSATLGNSVTVVVTVYTSEGLKMPLYVTVTVVSEDDSLPDDVTLT